MTEFNYWGDWIANRLLSSVGGVGQEMFSRITSSVLSLQELWTFRMGY